MHPLLKNSLTGQVALVTGAGSGIGRATAELLAFAGARVAALDRKREQVNAVCTALRAQGADVLPLVADISSQAEMDAALRTLRETWQRLDVVVANAGINGLWAPVEEISATDWDETLAVNLKGTFLTLRASVPLLKVNGGAVVVVSSVNGTRMFSNSGASAYATSKAGQLALARMLALELAPWKIRVNTVCPGSTQTGIFETTRQQNVDRVRPPVSYPNGDVPLTGHKIGTPEQVADLIGYLCSPLASHVTGAEVFVDGAESLLKG